MRGLRPVDGGKSANELDDCAVGYDRPDAVVLTLLDRGLWLFHDDFINGCPAQLDIGLDGMRSLLHFFDAQSHLRLRLGWVSVDGFLKVADLAAEPAKHAFAGEGITHDLMMIAHQPTAVEVLPIQEAASGVARSG